jgi:flavin reductase (DIM6/NTAB) family NADH-FMN oxidoreductase RutF
MVVGTFSSVSLDPPLVSFMPTRQSETYAALRESPLFCINVLAHDQQRETRTLSQRDADKFDKVAWTMSAHGVPLIDGAVAAIHCAPVQEIEAGDHLIVLCGVLDVTVERPVTPLLFFQGGYGGFAPTARTARVDAEFISAVRLAEVARPQLAALGERFDCEAVALVQIDDHDQTIAASFLAASVPTTERLGARTPLVPPLGDVAVAWSERNRARWLARVVPPDPQVLAMYEDRLAEVRERGYTVHRIPAGREEVHRAFTAALHEYALGQLTPARERAVHAAVAAGVDFAGTELPADDEADRIISITVPVFDPSASEPTNTGMVLRLSSLPATSTGAETRARIAALRQAAAEVTDVLAGPGRAELERYRGSGLRDRV